MTPEEVLAYRLCRLWGYHSPEELWSEMSFADWTGWVQYSNYEPWGELREDMRMASVVANVLAPFCKSMTQTPDLIYPYIQSLEDVVDEAHKVLALKKARYGSQPRKHGDSPGIGCPGGAEGGQAS